MKTTMKTTMKMKTFITGISISLASVVSSMANAQEALVNLETTEIGIHEIQVSDLSAYGVLVEGQDAGQLAITNRGVPIQIEVTGGAVLTPESTIRFIAEEVDTLYTGTNVYTLSLDSDSARRVAVDASPIPSRAPTATSYLKRAVFDTPTRYSFISPNAQDAFYAKRMVAVGEPLSESITLELDDVAVGGNTGSTKAKLNVDMWGGADQPGEGNDHNVTVSFNGDEVAGAQFDGLVEQKIETTLEQVKPGANVVRLTMPLDTGFAFDAINVNEITVDYPSQFVAKNNQLDFESIFSKFRISGFESSSLENRGDDLVIMRQDANGLAALETKQVSCRGESCTVQLGGTGQLAHYYVSSKDAIPSPTLAALPVDQDITSGNARYLIISHPDFIGATGNNLLETLKTEILSEMGSVDIVDVESIYAQFGDHLFDPLAIKEYIKFAHENRGTQYVVLVGGDVYDYRRFENEDATSFIPSLYAATGNNITYAPVDAKYVDLDDDNVPDLPIGRLPVRTVSELEILMQKRQDYINRDYAGSALLVADHFDEAQQYDFASDANEINSEYLGDFDVETAYADDLGASTVRANVRESIKEGVTLTAFFGHSSTNQWGFNGLFTGPDAARLENSGKPTVVMQWGCWNAYYVSPNEDSMGHRFLMEGDRGAVAVMGATTLTNADSERRLARLVFKRLSNGERLGEAVTNAKKEYAIESPNDLDVLLGWTVLGLPDLFVN